MLQASRSSVDVFGTPLRRPVTSGLVAITMDSRNCGSAEQAESAKKLPTQKAVRHSCECNNLLAGMPQAICRQSRIKPDHGSNFPEHLISNRPRRAIGANQ